MMAPRTLDLLVEALGRQTLDLAISQWGCGVVLHLLKRSEPSHRCAARILTPIYLRPCHAKNVSFKLV